MLSRLRLCCRARRAFFTNCFNQNNLRVAYRILIVEDAAEVRELLVEVFADAGFEVSEASTVASAMTTLSDAPVDIVITDCFLPDATHAFVHLIKRDHPRLPVIVLSGDPEAARHYLPGADEVIGKPVSIRDLMRSLSRFVDMTDGDGPIFGLPN